MLLIKLWTGPAVSEAAPVEIIFTNHDLLTGVMDFVNGGYYNYDHLIYKAGQTIPTSIAERSGRTELMGGCYDLQGRPIGDALSRNLRSGVYINAGSSRSTPLLWKPLRGQTR